MNRKKKFLSEQFTQPACGDTPNPQLIANLTVTHESDVMCRTTDEGIEITSLTVGLSGETHDLGEIQLRSTYIIPFAAFKWSMVYETADGQNLWKSDNGENKV